MPIPANQTCGNCKYLDLAGVAAFYGHSVSSGGSQIGYCRKQPPYPAQRASSPASDAPPDRKSYVLGVEWLEVRSADWCGDWSP